MLRSAYFSPAQVEAIVRDYRAAGLEPVDVAVMALAEKVALHAYRVTQEDIEELRAFNLTDGEILDVILAASSRSFFSKTLDATGAQPDQVYADLERELIDALAVGRPFNNTG